MTAYALRVLDRAGRTALQAFAAYLTLGATLGGIDWATALSAAIMAAVLSLLQALVDLPDFPDSWLGDAVGRALRTVGQTAFAGASTAVFVEQVSWGTVLSAALLAAIASLVTSAVAAPIGSGAARGTPEIVGVGNLHRV